MADWREEAIKNGFVCKDCHEPIHPKDRRRWSLHNHRCDECDAKWEDIERRTEAEEEYMPKCE